MATARSLIVNVAAKTVNFEAAMGRASKVTANFQSRIGVASIAVGSFLGNIATRYASRALGALGDLADKIDDIANVSERMRIPVQQLQGLQHAANMADVELGEFNTALSFMSRNLGNVQTDTSGLGKTLHDLGISAASLRQRGPHEAFLAIADAVASIPEPMRQAAVATAIFGRGSIAMTNMLKQGSAGIRAIGDEVKRFGASISESAVKAADAWDNSSKRLKLSWDGIKLKLGTPLMAGVASGIEDWGFGPGGIEGLKQAWNRAEAKLSMLSSLQNLPRGEKWSEGSIGGKIYKVFLNRRNVASKAYFAAIAKMKADEVPFSESLDRSEKQRAASKSWASAWQSAASTVGGVWTQLSAGAKTTFSEIDRYLGIMKQNITAAASVEHWQRLIGWVEQMKEAIKTPGESLLDQLKILTEAGAAGMVKGGMFQRIQKQLLGDYAGMSNIGMGEEVSNPRLQAVYQPARQYGAAILAELQKQTELQNRLLTSGGAVTVP